MGQICISTHHLIVPRAHSSARQTQKTQQGGTHRGKVSHGDTKTGCSDSRLHTHRGKRLSNQTSPHRFFNDLTGLSDC